MFQKTGIVALLLVSFMASQSGLAEIIRCTEETDGEKEYIFALGDNGNDMLFQKVIPRPAFGILPRDRQPWFKYIKGTVETTQNAGIVITHTDDAVEQVNCWDVSVLKTFHLSRAVGGQGKTYSGKLSVEWVVRQQTNRRPCTYLPFPPPAESITARNENYTCTELH